MFSHSKKTATAIAVSAVFLFFLDRYLKSLALASSTAYDLIPNWLNFHFVKNYYIAFSLPLGGRLLLAVIFVLLLGLLIYSIKCYVGKQYTEAALLFGVMLGAFSNLYDRLSLGYVVDYLDLRYFTVFNIADAIICCCISLLLLLQIKTKKEPAL